MFAIMIEKSQVWTVVAYRMGLEAALAAMNELKSVGFTVAMEKV